MKTYKHRTKIINLLVRSDIATFYQVLDVSHTNILYSQVSNKFPDIATERQIDYVFLKNYFVKGTF